MLPMEVSKRCWWVKFWHLLNVNPRILNLRGCTWSRCVSTAQQAMLKCQTRVHEYRTNMRQFCTPRPHRLSRINVTLWYTSAHEAYWGILRHNEAYWGNVVIHYWYTSTHEAYWVRCSCKEASGINGYIPLHITMHKCSNNSCKLGVHMRVLLSLVYSYCVCVLALPPVLTCVPSVFRWFEPTPKNIDNTSSLWDRGEQVEHKDEEYVHKG